MNRKIDELGRLVIPKEMRKKIGLENGDEVNLKLENDKIIITNPKTFELKEYIKEIQMYETTSIETYRALEDILEKL